MKLKNGGSGGCDPRIEAIVKLKSRELFGEGSGGCEPRIEDIIKLKKVGVGVVGVQSGVRSGWV